jgi:hypothetical protein
MYPQVRHALILEISPHGHVWPRITEDATSQWCGDPRISVAADSVLQDRCIPDPELDDFHANDVECGRWDRQKYQRPIKRAVSLRKATHRVLSKKLLNLFS